MAPSPAAGTAPVHQGPKGHTLLGNLRDFSRDQLGFYTRCAREYGDVVPVRLGPFPGFLNYHPDAIEEVLVVRNHDFIKSRGVRLMRAFLGDGLFTAEGDLGLRQTGRVLFMYTPASAGGYVEDLLNHRPIDDDERNQLRDRYHWEVVGPNPL